MILRRTVLAAFAAVLLAGFPVAAQDVLDNAREKLREAGEAAREATREAGEAARDAVRTAGEKIEEAAREAGRDVSDFLVENPELNRDLVDFGKRMGLPGFDEAAPTRGAELVVAPSPVIAGGEAQLVAGGLPGGATVTIAAGPSVAEATRLADVATSDRGTLAASVPVPDTAEPGSSLIFVIETADQRLRLVSDPVPVVDAADVVTVTGTLSNEGVECPALRGDDGTLYTLTPRDLGQFAPGDRVRVSGTKAEISTCMQGTTLVVQSIGAN